MLSAALKSGGPAASATPATSDLSSFPCIEEGKELDSSIEAAFREQLTLKAGQTLASSVPTRALSGSNTVIMAFV